MREKEPIIEDQKSQPSDLDFPCLQWTPVMDSIFKPENSKLIWHFEQL